MALYDDYFTNEDKPFAENLNDALLLSNVFDMTVDVEAPRMFSNSTWVNTTSPRKCSVSILTLKEGLPVGVTVGTDSETGNSTLTGTGTVSLSWYPNFNAFGKFKSIGWEAEGNITVNLKTSNGTTIANNISKGNIENQSSELRTLQEIVIELVFNNATLKSLTVTMENKSQERYGATVGITDVTDLDTTISAIQNKDTIQDERLGNVENSLANVFNYTLSFVGNKEINATATILCICTDVDGNAVEGKRLALGGDGEGAAAFTNQGGLAEWEVTLSHWGLYDFYVGTEHLNFIVDNWKRVETVSNGRVFVDTDGRFAKVKISGSFSTSTSAGEFTLGTINEAYKPLESYSTNFQRNTVNYFPVYIGGDDNVVKLYKNTTSSRDINCFCTLFYPLKTPLW